MRMCKRENKMAGSPYQGTNATRVLLLLNQWMVEEEHAVQLFRRRLRALRRRRTRCRMTTVITILFLLSNFVPRPRRQRCVWTRERSSTWWNTIVLGTFGEREWVENFRMRKETFMYLCNQVRPFIFRMNTRLRKAVIVERRVGITLWCLATPCEYRSVAHLFGVHRSTVCIIVHETCQAILHTLMDRYIRFPSGNEMKKVVDGFEVKWGFPQCVGAVDGSHIPISAPKLNHTDYYNRKGWYSMILQAIVDHEYLFRDICVGWPGSVHDARVFVNSQIYHRITEDDILDRSSRTLCGRQVPVCVVGDSAYPLQTWLMKPFTDTPTLSPQQKCFNYHLSKARIVVENAFGRLKARWRRLLKRNDMATENIPAVIAVCCILHNLCEVHQEGFNEAWLQEEDNQQPPSSPSPASASGASQSIRNTFVEYLYTLYGP